MSGRIVITATGVVSSIGIGPEEFEAALYSGRSGVRATRGPGETGPRACIADSDPQLRLGNRGWRGLDRSARFHCVSTSSALRDSGLASPSGYAGLEGVGLVCGTMFGSVSTMASFDRSALQEGPNLVRPLEFANAAINSCTDQAAIRLRLRGMNATVSAGLASGLVAIDHAAQSLRCGRAVALLAGGVEALCEEICDGFEQAGLVTVSGQVQPFAAGRDGVAPGEASAVLMLELEEAARSRGLRPVLEICGTAACRSSRTDSGAASSIRLALAAAGISPDDVSCIVTSGSGSISEDDAEGRALASVFGARLRQIPACAPKAAFGECMGAAGALLALVAGMSLDHHRLPPTPGAQDNEYGVRLSRDAQAFRGNYALVDAFGCDNDAALVMKSI